MGRVSVCTTVAAPPECVFDAARDPDRLPMYMPSLKRIEVLERAPDGSFIRARWFVEEKIIISRHKLCWVQEDVWDRAALTCRSRLDEFERGRYKKMDAEWRFIPHARGTEMIMNVDYLMEHPLLNDKLHRVLDGIMERNNRELLSNIKRRAEKMNG